MAFYKGKKILVTGGTGTIGQHLIRRLLLDEPAVIRVFSRDEYKQFEMQHDLKDYPNIRYLVGDVRDVNRLKRAMEDIEYVFHLAAMKQVPACEYNPFEAVQTNVVGTQNVIQAAIEAGVSKVLFTSSDKAVSPSNTYGATKLMGEKLISAAEYQKGPKKTSFVSVRFGNIMGSRGSVIPLFKKQIIEKKSITLTSKDMTRYMMTPSQAISLLLMTIENAKGGEVFVLKMPIIRLVDLASIVINEVRLQNNIDQTIEVREIGLRPGEKINEELMTNDEKKNVIEKEYVYIVPSIYAGPDLIYNSLSIKDAINAEIQYVPNKIIKKEILKKWILNEHLI